LRTAKDFLAKNVLDKAFFLIEGHLPDQIDTENVCSIPASMQ
jgi:hypothetical protein